MYTYTHIHTYTHVYTYIHTYTYANTCIHTNTHTFPKTTTKKTIPDLHRAKGLFWIVVDTASDTLLEGKDCSSVSRYQV